MAADPARMEEREKELRVAMSARRLQRVEEARALVEEANRLSRDDYEDDEDDESA